MDLCLGSAVFCECRHIPRRRLTADLSMPVSSAVTGFGGTAESLHFHAPWVELSPFMSSPVQSLSMLQWLYGRTFSGLRGLISSMFKLPSFKS